VTEIPLWKEKQNLWRKPSLEREAELDGILLLKEWIKAEPLESEAERVCSG
jgi:hypothetical protein